MQLSDFRLANVKNMRGREGAGFSATVMAKNKVVADVVDYGDGGPIDITWVDGARNKPPAPISKFLKSAEALAVGNQRESALRAQYPQLYQKEPMPTTWDQADFVVYLLEQHDAKKIISRYAKKYGLVYRYAKDTADSVRFIKSAKPVTWTKELVRSTLDVLTRKHGKIIVLNDPSA